MSSLLATATAAKSGSTVTAVVNGISTTVQVFRDLTVATGDVIVVERIGSQWVALGRMFTAAPATPINEVPPPSQPSGITGTTVFGPVETRSYRNGAWRTDNTHVYQGSYGGGGNHTGAVFYGAPPQSLAGAVVTGSAIIVRRQAGGAFAAQQTTMRLMTEATRPGGAPTLTSSASGPNLAVNQALTGGFSVPTSWAQSMVDGTAGGLAFFTSSGSPYVVFSGLGDWGPAFNLIVSWTR